MRFRPGFVPILLFLLLLSLFPFFAQVMVEALEKLRLDPHAAMFVVMGILFGSAINIPVRRITHHEDVMVHPFPLFGFLDLWPQYRRVRRETVIAVNVGGCVIPGLVALYEILWLLADSWTHLFSIALAVAVNTAVCYRLATPVAGIGIAMPAFAPPLVAVLAALLLGADLLHLREISRIATGMASIGGAGPFDGIVLSGILAAYLA